MRTGHVRLRATLVLLCLPLAAGAGGGDERKKVAEEKAPAFDKAYLTDKANIETGRKVWETQCRHCHGAAAYPGKAPKLNPGRLAPDLIYDRVTFGFGKMPAWKEVFSLEQRKAVVAYIKSDDFSP